MAVSSRQSLLFCGFVLKKNIKLMGDHSPLRGHGCQLKLNCDQTRLQSTHGVAEALSPPAPASPSTLSTSAALANASLRLIASKALALFVNKDMVDEQKQG